jgi:hypothetical protein
MRNLYCLAVLPFASALAAVHAPTAAAGEAMMGVSVAAGAYDRQDTVVTITVPPGWAQFNAVQAQGGPLLPFQVGADRKAWFIIPKLAKGEFQNLLLKSSPAATVVEGQVVVNRRGADMTIGLAGRGQVLAYRAQQTALPRADIKPVFSRAGYLHPVFSPSHKALTDDYPTNHLHHHGVWAAWPHTLFEGRKPNFWEMGLGLGTVEAVGVAGLTDGPVWGGLVAQHRMVDLSAAPAQTALNETWELRVFNLGRTARPYYLFDLALTQTCAGPDPIKLPEYRYGGLGVRGHKAWDGKQNAVFLTSEGETDRVKGNTARARWCYLGGQLEGGLSGLAVLGHPENFRAPQPLRLHPDEPFLCFVPTQLGEFAIAPGEPYAPRYRFVVFDGPPDRMELDRLWNDFAHPPVATLLTP